MKLRVLKQTKKPEACTIRCGKNGVIWFGKGVQGALGLEAGDKVDFLQDEDNSKDFFLKKMGGSIELRAHKASSMSANNTSFVRAVGLAYDVEIPFTMLVSEKPNDEGVYALIMED